MRYAIAIGVAFMLEGCGGDDGSTRVAGVARYENRQPLASGQLGVPKPAPARFVRVALVDEATGDELATTIADELGAFTFERAAGGDARVVISTTSLEPPLEVVRLDRTRHDVASAPFALDGEVALDVLVTVDSGAAQAFNAYDTLLDVFARVPVLFGDVPVAPLTAIWELGAGDGGTFTAGTMIRLRGDAADDDGFDDAVILHEAGHYVEEAYGASDNPRAPHGHLPVAPAVAWSEGYATYFALGLRDDPLYIDTNAGAGFVFDAEQTVTAADPGGGLEQLLSEDTVAEILWDLGDETGATDDDPAALGHDAVLGLQPRLRTAGRRGAAGLDLVDVLDTLGAEACDALRAIVTDARGFPYDYPGC
jgi:hypothetical protein